MKFWTIEDGEKCGPFEDYEIREQISSGAITAESRIWYEGAAGWEKAGEITLLKGEFIEKEVTPPPLPQVVIQRPPFLPWRRMGARWFDLLLFQLIFIIILRFSGHPMIQVPDAENAGWMLIASLVPLIIMEGALLGWIGTTPGKWLLGLRVTDAEDKLLRTTTATVRAMRAWVLGMGMRLFPLELLGHAFNFWLGKKRGAPLWDLTTGHAVRGREISTGRCGLFWAAMTLVFGAIVLVAWPELQPILEAEWQKQEALRKLD